MGWGIAYKTTNYIRRQSFTSFRQLEDAIEDVQESIADTKATILAYAVATPKDIIAEGNCDRLQEIKITVNDYLGFLQEETELLRALEDFKFFLEETNNEKNIEKFNG